MISRDPIAEPRRPWVAFLRRKWMVLPGLAMALVMSISVFLTVQQSGAGTNGTGHDPYWVAIAGAITGVVVGPGLRGRRAPRT